MKSFKIAITIAILLFNAPVLEAADFNEKTVGAANYVITTGGGSGGYQLDDSSTHTSGNGYDVSDSDNHLRSYDNGTIDISMTPKEVGEYTFETTIHAPGKTEPTVDAYGDYKYLMKTGADDAPGISSNYTLEVNSAFVDSNMRFKLDDFELYNVQNNEIIEFTTVITSPTGVKTIVTTDDSVDADYNIDYDLTASASSSTYLDLALSGNKTSVANPTGDASLGANGIMMTVSATAGVKGPSGTIVGSQELDPTSGFNQDFTLSIVNNDPGVCGVDASTLDYYLVDEALSGLDWIYNTYQEAQTGFAATGTSNFSGSITSQYLTGIQTPARNGSGDGALNQTIDASALQGGSTNLLKPWDPSQPIHINLSEFTNSQDIEHDNKLFANTNVKIWIPLFDKIDELGGCDAYSFTIKADAVPGTAVGTGIDGSTITEGASISDSVIIKDNTVTVKPSPEPIKTNMVTDLLMHNWTWGGFVTADDIDNNKDMGHDATVTGAASYRGGNYSQYNGVSYRDYKQELSMKTHYWIGESEHGYELMQKWDPTDFEYINEPTHVTYQKYDLDGDSPQGYKPRVRMDQADYTTVYGYLPAGETNWESDEQMYYDTGKEGSSYLEWSDVYDESRTVAGVKVVYDKEIIAEDYVDEEGVVQTPAILVDMYTALRVIDSNADMDPTQVSASQTINSDLLDGATYPNEASNPLYQKTKYKSNNFDVDTRHYPSSEGGMTFNTFYTTSNNRLFDNNGLSEGSAGNEIGLEYKFMPGEQEDLELELIGNPTIYKHQLVSDDEIDVHDADFRYYITLPKSSNVNNDYELIEMLVSDANSLTTQSCQLPKLDGETTSCSYNAGNILKADIRDFEIERVYNTTTNRYIVHFYNYDVPSIDNFEDVLPTFKLKIKVPYSEVVANKTIQIKTDAHAETDTHGVSFGYKDSWHLVYKEYILSTILADKIIEEAPTEKKVDTPINYTTHFQRVTNPEGSGSDKKGFVLLPTNGDESGSSFNGDYTISDLQIDGIDYASAVVGTDYSELMCSEQPINDESLINFDTTDASLWTSCDTAVNPTMIYINYGPSSDYYNYIDFQINPTGNKPGDVYMSKSIYPDFGINANSNIVETDIYDEASIELKKVDEEGNPVKGVSFEIYNTEGELVQTITTNSEGIASSATIYVSTAIAPDYTVVEKSAPAEYVLDTEPYTVQLNDKINYVDGDRDDKVDSDSDGNELNDPIVNTRKYGQIELNKVDQNMDPVEGVVFEVYNAPYSSSAPVVATLTTDSNGYALSSEIVAGDYVVKEVSAPEGYVFDSTITYNVSITENGVIIPIDGDNDDKADSDSDGDKLNDPIVNKLLVDDLKIDKTSINYSDDDIDGIADMDVSTNQEITYAVLLDNSGTNYDRENVTITDLLDDPYLDKTTVNDIVLTNLTTGEYLTPDVDYTVDKPSGTIKLNTLAAETEYQITFKVMTTSTFDDPDVNKTIDLAVDNTVTVAVDGEELEADYHIPIIPGSDIQITKELISDTNENELVGLGELLTYGATITNGDTEQTNVVITDTPDSDDLSNLQIIEVSSSVSGSLTSDDYTISGNEITFSNLAPNEVIEITYTLDVTSDFADETDVTNEVCLSTDEIRELGSSEPCANTNTPKEIKDLIIDKSSTSHVEGTSVDNSDTSVSTNQLITYVITLDNTGTNFDQANVSIIDLLDDQYLDEASASNVVVTNMTTGSDLVAGTDYGIDDATNTLTINTLAAATEYQITFDVMTTTEFDDSFISRLIDKNVDNTVTVTVEGEELTADYHIPVNLDDIVDPDKPESNVTITKDFVSDTNGNDYAGVDETLTYKLSVTNGDIEQSNVVITDTPDSDDLSNLQITGITSSIDGAVSSDDYTISGNEITFSNLAPNEVIEITYTLDVASDFVDETDVTNGVCLSTDELLEIGADDLCDNVTTPKEIDSLVIDKTSSTHVEGTTEDTADTSVSTDQLITYVITLDNTGTNFNRSNVLVTDLLDDQYLDEASASNIVVTNMTTSSKLVEGVDYSVDNNTNSVILATLEAKTEYQITFDVMTTTEFDDEAITKLVDTTVDNTVTVTVEGEELSADYHIPVNLDDIVDPDKPESNVTITKDFVSDTSGNDYAGVGETLTYKVSVTNGDIEQSNVVITDTPDSDDLSNLQITGITSSIDGALSSDDYTISGNEITFSNLAPNEVIEITYTLDVASNFTDNTEITNGVCLHTDELLEISAEDLCDNVTTPKEIDNLVIDKTSSTHVEGTSEDTAAISVGSDDVITYVITLDNTGTNYDRSNVVVTDLLDDQYLDEASASNVVVTNMTTGSELVAGTDYSIDDATNTLTINRLAAATEYQIAFDVKTVSSIVDATDDDLIVDNTVTVTVDGEDRSAEYHIPVILDKIEGTTIVNKIVEDSSGDSKVQGGEELIYTLELSNNTSSDAHNVVVRDSMLELMPSWLSYNGEVTMEPSDVAYSGSLETGNLTFDVVEAGSTIKVSYTVTASKPLPNDITELRNIVTDNGANPDECAIDSEDCSETVTPLDPDSPIIDPSEGNTVISKEVEDGDGDGVIRSGEELNYTIKLTNTGVNEAHNVVVRDSMLENVPTWMTFNNDVVISPNDIAYSGDLTTSDLTFYAIEPNQTVEISYSLTAAQPIPENIMEAVNIVTDNGETPDVIDPDTCKDSEDCASVITPTYHDDVTIDPGEAETEINKEFSDSDGDGIISGGEVLTYTVTVSNNETSDAHNVVVRDSMLEDTPKWLTFNDDVTVNPTRVDYSGDLTKKGLTFNTIKAGEEVTIKYSLTADDTLPNDITEVSNIATDNGELVDTCIEEDDCIDVVSPIEGSSKIEKFAEDASNDGVLVAGEAISYKLVISNTTPYDVNDVSVRDSMLEEIPSWLTYNNDIVVESSDITYSGKLTEGDMVIDKIASGEEVTITYSLTTNDLIPEGVEALNVVTNNGIDPATIDPDSCKKIDTCSSTLTPTNHIETETGSETGSETGENKSDNEEMSISDKVLAVTGSRGALILVDLFMIVIIGFTLKRRVTKY